MLNITFKNQINISNNRRKHINSIIKSQETQNSRVPMFKGNPDFVMVSGLKPHIPQSIELKQISNVLRTLGVEELEVGDNILLAKLLKSAMCRVKKLGFEVPTRIKCDSKLFRENFPQKVKMVAGGVFWNDVDEPILCLNPEYYHWGSMANNTNTKDPRQPIWHEIGHYLHMQNHRNAPMIYRLLDAVKLDEYQQNLVKNYIGTYAIDGSDKMIPDTIAEIFARLVSGESYQTLHPELFNIYSKYNGPMPKKKPSTF